MARTIAKSSESKSSRMRFWRAKIEVAHVGGPAIRGARLLGAARDLMSVLGTGMRRVRPAADSPLLDESELYRFLRQAISGLRWGTIILLFVLTFLEPKVGRIGLANWQLILLFAVYNLAS